MRLKLDAGYAVELPAARTLARVWALPVLETGSEVYRSGSALLRRPHGGTDDPVPADFRQLADKLADRLAALPDRTDAGAVYRALRMCGVEADRAWFAGVYLLSVLRAVRAAARAWRPPSAQRRRDASPLTAAERARRSHAARLAREAEVSATWVRRWLVTATPGERVLARALYDAACAELEGDLPGLRVFYRAGDDLLGRRTRTAAGYSYRVPDSATADVLLDEIARVALDEAASAIGNYLTSNKTDTEASERRVA
ncbi:hypothetical protein COUCH_00470 [Couchioplanes caeruleus]|uniref:hypothetical protein n=1 Tax=Couchioplanes caeruleus TaxID=56438 RepID=UPI0020BDF5F2|nr:hypothetical protein [Couchioplanes caeruleus]UQU64877.1 hypothetical protein COUCH_00470 [Couchioplanes caeruleus]